VEEERRTVDDAGLAGDRLAGPVEVAVVQTESAVLGVATTQQKGSAQETSYPCAERQERQVKGTCIFD
jgi:hypothetical protein